MATPIAHWLLEQEARALLTRLGKVRPFALQMTMVPAAAISPSAQTAIETHMTEAHRTLKNLVEQFLDWLRTAGQSVSPAEAQRRFTLLRMRFNGVISHFDIFADVIVQRSEHETGVWVAGLDAVGRAA